MPHSLVVVCGWPLSGKSTMARHVQSTLDIEWIDIDELRMKLGLQPLSSNPDEGVLRAIEERDMRAAYRCLSELIETYMRFGQSLMVTATMSSAFSQKATFDLAARYPETKLRVIWCVPQTITDHELEVRLSARTYGENYWGGVNSVERYREVRDRFVPLSAPHLKLDTSRLDLIDDNVQKALEYIRS